MKIEFSWMIFKYHPNIKWYENPSSGIQVVPCRQSNMTELIVAFPSFADVHKNRLLWTKVKTEHSFCHCWNIPMIRKLFSLELLINLNYCFSNACFHSYSCKIWKCVCVCVCVCVYISELRERFTNSKVTYRHIHMHTDPPHTHTHTRMNINTYINIYT